MAIRSDAGFEPLAMNCSPDGRLDGFAADMRGYIGANTPDGRLDGSAADMRGYMGANTPDGRLESMHRHRRLCEVPSEVPPAGCLSEM